MVFVYLKRKKNVGASDGKLAPALRCRAGGMTVLRFSQNQSGCRLPFCTAARYALGVICRYFRKFLVKVFWL